MAARALVRVLFATSSAVRFSALRDELRAKIDADLANDLDEEVADQTNSNEQEDEGRARLALDDDRIGEVESIDLSHNRGECEAGEEAVFDGFEMAQIISDYHQAEHRSSLLFFPGASPAWVMRAMQIKKLAPCDGSGDLCKGIPISSDAPRLRLNDFAALKARKSYFSEPIASFLVKEGLVDNKADLTKLASDVRVDPTHLHPGKFVDWIKRVMCPHFDSLGLKPYISTNKILMVDHTTTGLSVLGLAQIFEDCRAAWQVTVNLGPLKMINLQDFNRINFFPHSLDPSRLQTVMQVAAYSLVKYYVGDKTPFGRFVAKCGIAELITGCDASTDEVAAAKATSFFQGLADGSRTCQRSAVPQEKPAIASRVFALPSFDQVAASLNSGSRSWEEVQAKLIEAGATCTTAACSSYLAGFASFDSWPDSGYANQVFQIAEIYVQQPGPAARIAENPKCYTGVCPGEDQCECCDKFAPEEIEEDPDAYEKVVIGHTCKKVMCEEEGESCDRCHCEAKGAIHQGRASMGWDKECRYACVDNKCQVYEVTNAKGMDFESECEF
jgi:hypothetical protein